METKESLHFIVNWANNKERSWSGTNYSLFCALQQHFNVIDHDTYQRSSLLTKVINKLLPWTNDMQLSSILPNREKHKDLKGKVFQFSEIALDNPSTQTYIYQDVSVNHIFNLRKNDIDTYRICALTVPSQKALQKRNSSQLSYYKSCAGIFTMGQWLAKELKEQFPEIAHKIHHVGGGYKP